jgi:hypothetical protein
MANIGEQQLRSSGKWHIPVYSLQQQEGFFVGLAQLVSSRSRMPAYLHAQLDTFVNDQFKTGTFKLSMSQQNAEEWYRQIMAQFGEESSNSKSTRGDRTRPDHGKSLRDIYSSLGIKSRFPSANNLDQHNNQQQQPRNQQPFAMVNMRTGDVDQAFVAIDGQQRNIFDNFLGHLLQPSQANSFMARAFEFARQGTPQKQQMRGVFATNLNEFDAKIPTSAGLPLHILSSIPVLASLEGQAQVAVETAKLDSPLGVQCQLDVNAMATAVHIQKMVGT